MFDVGFSELLIIAVVALLVLGPERLPKAARFAGLWVRRARAQWVSVKAELERELASEELQRHLKTPLAELKPQMQALASQLRDEFAGIDPGRGILPGEKAPVARAIAEELSADNPPADKTPAENALADQALVDTPQAVNTPPGAP